MNIREKLKAALESPQLDILVISLKQKATIERILNENQREFYISE